MEAPTTTNVQAITNAIKNNPYIMHDVHEYATMPDTDVDVKIVLKFTKVNEFQDDSGKWCATHNVLSTDGEVVGSYVCEYNACMHPLMTYELIHLLPQEIADAYMINLSCSEYTDYLRIEDGVVVNYHQAYELTDGELTDAEKDVGFVHIFNADAAQLEQYRKLQVIDGYSHYQSYLQNSITRDMISA